MILRRPASRRGTIIIIVAGICALLAGLAIAFLGRMRSDAEESALLMREAQSRVMLNAGLTYVQEASRLGWGLRSSGTLESRESFGWIDVRDGGVGPRDIRGQRMLSPDPGAAANDAITHPDGDGPAGSWFPVVGGHAARCPMYVMQRPPFAISQKFALNPMRPDADCTQNYAALIRFSVADPQPAVTLAGDVDPNGLANFNNGDQQPRSASLDLAWFRVYRMTRADCQAHRDLQGRAAPIAWSPAIFTITCGAGATAGYRSWAEVTADQAQGRFTDDPSFFAQLQAQETRLFFIAEWSPVAGGNVGEHYVDDMPADESRKARWNGDYRTHSYNHGGSFRWIERLVGEPGTW